MAYTSRSLSTAERYYLELKREGLAIVYGIKKFHNYLFGWKFTIYTDHSARIQRWALTSSMYKYTIRFKSGTINTNADALSRLPLPDTPDKGLFLLTTPNPLSI